MPVVNFDALPDDARAWVFGAAAPVVGAAAQSLLSTVDAHLATSTPRAVAWGTPDRTPNPFLAMSRSCEIATIRARLPQPPTRKARRGRVVAARQCPTCGRGKRFYGRLAVCLGCFGAPHAG